MSNWIPNMHSIGWLKDVLILQKLINSSHMHITADGVRKNNTELTHECLLEKIVDNVLLIYNFSFWIHFKETCI